MSEYIEEKNCVDQGNIVQFTTMINKLKYGGATLGMYCIRLKRYDFLEQLLKSAIDFTPDMGMVCHLLPYAVALNDITAVKLILDYKVNSPDIHNLEYHTALCFAIRETLTIPRVIGALPSTSTGLDLSLIKLILSSPHLWKCRSRECHRLYDQLSTMNIPEDSCRDSFYYNWDHDQNVFVSREVSWADFCNPK